MAEEDKPMTAQIIDLDEERRRREPQAVDWEARGRELEESWNALKPVLEAQIRFICDGEEA